MDPVIVFGQVLRRIRKQQRLTQEQLALSAEVERNFVSLIERGVNQPTIRVLFRLSRALGMNPSEILREVENEIKHQPED